MKGAFTDAKSDRSGRFELADGGTLFLDEIANIPVELQSKLLRVLETGEFERVGSSRTRRADVRIVSATNADIDKEVSEGRFRQDLFYRLNTVEIHLPPLRDRREDIPLLVQHFLQRHAKHYRKSLTKLDSLAMETLLDYAWPGNVRELDHIVERAVLMAQGDEVGSADLGLRTDRPSDVSLDEMTLEEAERLVIQRAMSRYEGNANEAAKALGLSRSTMYRRLEKYAL